MVLVQWKIRYLFCINVDNETDKHASTWANTHKALASKCIIYFRNELKWKSNTAKGAEKRSTETTDTGLEFLSCEIKRIEKA